MAQNEVASYNVSKINSRRHQGVHTAQSRLFTINTNEEYKLPNLKQHGTNSDSAMFRVREKPQKDITFCSDFSWNGYGGDLQQDRDQILLMHMTRNATDYVRVQTASPVTATYGALNDVNNTNNFVADNIPKEVSGLRDSLRLLSASPVVTPLPAIKAKLTDQDAGTTVLQERKDRFNELRQKDTRKYKVPSRYLQPLPRWSGAGDKSYTEWKARHTVRAKSSMARLGRRRFDGHNQTGQRSRHLTPSHHADEDDVASEQEEEKIVIPPYERFQQAARTVLTLIKATKYTSHAREDPKLLSFTQYQNDILRSKTAVYGNGLSFDPMHYRSHKESPLSNEAKSILCMDPELRTPDQLHTALLAMQTAVDAFSEFPINMQHSLIKVCSYEHFGPKRVIIRQGHTAENFYFIISGTAVVTLLETNKKTGDAYSRTLAMLGKGNSFGELALMHAAKRSATVTCQDSVGLLAVSREDFIDIFMHAEKDKEPEHIRYLKTMDVIEGWPVDLVPRNDPSVCLFTYFRRGTVMCRDSNKSDWLYFIKSGSCRVLKSLCATKPTSPDTISESGESLQLSLHTAPAHKSHLAPVPAPANRSQHAPVSRAGTLLKLRDLSQERKAIEEHKRHLDAIYRGRHDVMLQQERKASDNRKQQNSPRMFVQIQKLIEKDTFGLEHVAFSQLGGVSSVSLVSDGAEAVLINKKFFLQHLSDDIAKKLRTTIRPYPNEESLQNKLQDKTNWEAFKSMTVQDHVTMYKLLRETSSLYF